MAALRNGIKTVIIPAENGKDLEEIDQTVRKALRFVLVDQAEQQCGRGPVLSERRRGGRAGDGTKAAWGEVPGAARLRQ